MSLKIDWVEIPAGKFLIGLSADQKDQIRNKIWEEFASGISDHKKSQLLDLIKRRQKPEFKYTKSDKELLTDGKPRYVLRLESILRKSLLQKEISLNTFYISRYPITNQQMYQFVKKTPRKMREDYLYQYQQEKIYKKDVPALTDWHSADLFSHWLGARLPTVTEWEKAARGEDGLLYPWGNEWDISRGNLDEKSSEYIERKDWKGHIGLLPVDSFPRGKSPYGVMDMAGNACEWTMTIKADPQTGGDTHIFKSWSIKLGGTSPWFDNIISFDHPDGVAFQSEAQIIGFRIVKDIWQKTYWNGWSKPKLARRGSPDPSKN